MPSEADARQTGFRGLDSVKSINGGTALASGPGVSFPDGSMINSLTASIYSSAGTSAGGVTVEGSLNGIDWFALGAEVTFTAQQVKTLSFSTGPLRFVRARISTAMVGGNVSVDFLLSPRVF